MNRSVIEHATREPQYLTANHSAIYTPAVMIAALLIFVVPPTLLGGTWSQWFYRALVLLVIACPCALVISTPVSIRNCNQ